MIPILKNLNDCNFRNFYCNFDKNYNIIIHNVDGYVVKDARKLLKIKQKDLASLLNVTSAYVGQVEKGQKNLTDKFYPFLSILIDLDILYYSHLGVNCIIENFHTIPLRFSLQTPSISSRLVNSIVLSPLDLLGWIEKQYNSICETIQHGKIPSGINSFPRQSLFYLSLFAPDISNHPFFSSISFSYYNRHEKGDTCASLHLESSGAWALEYSSYISFRLSSGQLSDFMLLSLASILDIDTSCLFSISTSESILRFKCCEFFHINCVLINNLIFDFLKNKDINIPIIHQ